MIDIKAIREAAEAVRNDVFHVRHDFGKHYVLVGPGEYFMGRVRGKERADFIATANPATVLALCDEIERLRKDAARYQWIRHGDNDEIVMKGDCRGVYLPRNERLDAAIDAAMESK